MRVVGGKLFCRLFLAVGKAFSTEIPASEDGPRLLLEGQALLRVLTALWMLVGCIIAVGNDLVDDRGERPSVAED